MLSPAKTIGTMPDGRPVESWRLGEPDGIELTVLSYGARAASLKVPAPGGRREVLLVLDGLAAWLADGSHIGAIAGRFANRIAGATFTLDGREVRLAANSGPNNLHGGPIGFGRSLWTGTPAGDALLLSLDSPDGDQNFPGAMHVELRYSVVGDTVTLAYTATTDAPTVVNLTSHAYFNLAGGGDIMDHVVTLAADRFLPVNEAGIPTGERRSVAGTPFDFRQPMTVGARIGADDPQLKLGKGYDHCFVLADAPRPAPVFAARVAAGGLAWDVATTEPAVQFYTGNNLKGAPHAWRSALCLETQHFPNSPNQPDFPSTVLRPSMTFRSVTTWRFSAA
jgi:aldose 1-epimerase